MSAKDMFGGGSLVAARDKMREWHDWYAAVNEKWGLERGDDIHETGARHKSLEEHNRELHRENKSLEEELETKRRAMKGLTTMIENLTRRQEEIQSQIAELKAHPKYPATMKEANIDYTGTESGEAVYKLYGNGETHIWVNHNEFVIEQVHESVTIDLKSKRIVTFVTKKYYLSQGENEKNRRKAVSC